MTKVYGSLGLNADGSPPKSLDALKTWTPRRNPKGHNGRYLWTDAFGVVNFLTLYKATNEERYLILAERLVEVVHDTLGRTRDGTRRLPNATDENPLGGGLRIGKLTEGGSDCDGQYYHYLTIWMFALNRLAVVSSEKHYNDLAADLVRAVHQSFVYTRRTPQGEMRDVGVPKLVWKVDVDLDKILVFNEGNLDAVEGYVVYGLIQRYSAKSQNEESGGEGGGAKDSKLLQNEIAELYKGVCEKMKSVAPAHQSSDPLDLGMTLWVSHWALREDGVSLEEWAQELQRRARRGLGIVFAGGFFDRNIQERLAFREFGTALGLRCVASERVRNSTTEEDIYRTWAAHIVRKWENAGFVPPFKDIGVEDDINLVMYCAAVEPGVFCMRDEEIVRR
ncbi:hypothetical protein BU17DRAFT_77574 [Hysterangium stoloniferum]|nr:hypothetical protein BU17DRAFT_77574 [Hysterangium stoloniferum]